MTVTYERFLKYLVFMLLVGVLFVFESTFRYQASKTFDFNWVNLFSFLMFTVIGVGIALLPKDIFNKDTWNIGVKLELLPILLIFFMFSTLIVFPTTFMIEMIHSLRLSVFYLLVFSQLMFGYTFIHFLLEEKKV